ncbi:hypothetical protein Q5P01_008983 [Channa striata]|uniref:Cadherin domain-containing protein n=1 Tax=Channa striata TaxID=64152 RepID=A0AA88N3H8_CHASR|nr:hypothetical protein Q5P01_008983 [Channa striata]
MAKDLGLDLGRLADRNLRVVSGTKQDLFKVNPRDGALLVNQRVDREELCAETVPCITNLKAVVENPLEMHQVTVEILDVNDNSPKFPEENYTLEVLESATVGSRFQIEGAHDLDVGVNSLQLYKLHNNQYFRLETEEFGEDGKIPFLILQRPLDREDSAQHWLVITAIDGGKPPKSGTINVTVIVSDVNDNSPVCDKQKYSVTIKENAPAGTFLLRVNASDSDEGINGEIEFSLRNKLRGLSSEPFDLDGRTGKLTVKERLDYEEKQVYEIKVLAADKGAVSLSTHCNVIVRVEDVNDNRPEIEITSLSSSIPEDAPPGTVVALMGVTDLDSGVNGQVVCSVPDDVPFDLKPSPDGQSYSLVTKGYLDKEAVHEYNIKITAKDLGSPALSSLTVIKVDVLDVNDNSPLFTESPYNFYVAENNKAGMSIFSVSASDADGDENAVVTYLLDRKSPGPTVTTFLNINEANGTITALKSFDFETLKTFQFQVVATDSGTPSLSSNVTVNVFILDQNDNAPVILYPVSSNGSAEGVEEVPRNVNAGHLVTKVRAYDADIGYNGWLLFTLQQVTDHSLFALDRYTGQIRTLRSFTETDEAEHKLVILVKDNGNVSLSATATVVVKVVEPKEAFAASDVKSAAKDDEDSDVTLYLMITLGSVSALFLISIIVLIAMQCSKSPDYTSKYLQDTNYDGTLCHSIQYRSGDKRYMLVGPRMSIGSTIVPGSHANTLVLPDRRRTAEEFQVVATDSGTPFLSSNVTVNVFILDQNDNAPVILYPVSSNGSAEGVEEVPRNVNAGHLVTKVRAYDADIGYNGWLLFTLQQVTDHSLFALDRYTGQIRTLRSFTETDEAEHKLVILVKDNGNVSLSATATVVVKVVEPKEAFAASDVKNSGTPSLSSNVTVNVFILDQNDNAPVILYPVSSNGSAEGVEEVPRNVNAGHLVTKVRAYDADIGYNGWLLFTLQQVTDHSLFALDRYTGQIRTLRSFTETDEAEHKLVILVKDNGNVSLSATATVVVKVVEPKEAFAASDVKSAAKVDEDSDVTLYLMITLGSVSALFLISIIVLIAMQCSKSPDYTSKYLQDANYDGTLCHSIQYRSGDKRYMLVGPRMSTGSTIVPGSHANTLVFPDRRRTSEEFHVVATDSGTPSLSSNVTVNVFILDQNDNAPVILYPVSSNGSAEGVEEVPRNVNAGHLVTKVRAYDADIGYNGWLLFTLQQVTDHSLFALDRYTGQIRTLRSFTETDEAEHKLVILFQVVATDSGTPSLSSNVTVNVFILDQNDNAPVILYPVSSNGSAEGVEEVPRNVNAGHLVTKVRAYDADIGYNGWLLFTLQQVTDHSLFALDRYTGQIRTLRSFTETDEAEHKLVILVKDNGNVSLSATATVVVKVVEPKEAFAASDVKSSTKVDEEDNVAFYLMITLGSVSVLFVISIIVLIAMQCSKSQDYTSKYLQDANYDGTLCHSIQYRSGDKRYMLVGPRMSIGSTIVPGSHANTLVLPDRRRTSEEELYQISIQENTAIGTLVIRMNATDLDKDTNGEVEYSFGKTLSQKVYNTFELDKLNGEIRVKGLVDYEENDAYELDIEASDKGQPPLTDNGQISALKSFDFETLKTFQFHVVATDSGTPSLSSNVTVNVFILDQNDNAPVILYPVSSNGSAEGVEEVPRNVNAGHLVTKVRAYDADIGYNGWLLFTLQQVTDHSLFALDRYTGQIRTLRSFTETDEAEHKLVILEVYQIVIEENVPISTKIFTMNATDPDEGTNGEIEYSLGKTLKKRVYDIFELDKSTGEIRVKGAVDYEENDVYKLDVEASDKGQPPLTDSGTPSLSSNVTVNVFILDQNDNAPVILYPVSSNGSAEGVEEVPRNVNAGHLVTKVRAYDADIGYNGWLLFTLQQVTDHSLFALDRYTGQIRTLRSFTETDEAEHKLVILVKDNGNVSLSATATVVVKVVEPKEAFAASDVKSAAKDSEDSDVTLYLMITLGSVSALFLISIIVLIAMQCSKSPDYTSKYLQDTNYDGTLCHSIQYRSGDKRYMLVGPRMSIGSTIVPGSHANTLVLPDRRRTSVEVSLSESTTKAQTYF